MDGRNKLEKGEEGLRLSVIHRIYSSKKNLVWRLLIYLFLSSISWFLLLFMIAISHLCIDQNGETVVAARIVVRWRKTRKEEVDHRGFLVVLAVVA